MIFMFSFSEPESDFHKVTFPATCEESGLWIQLLLAIVCTDVSTVSGTGAMLGFFFHLKKFKGSIDHARKICLIMTVLHIHTCI